PCSPGARARSIVWSALDWVCSPGYEYRVERLVITRSSAELVREDERDGAPSAASPSLIILERRQAGLVLEEPADVGLEEERGHAAARGLGKVVALSEIAVEVAQP